MLLGSVTWLICISLIFTLAYAVISYHNLHNYNIGSDQAQPFPTFGTEQYIQLIIDPKIPLSEKNMVQKGV